MKEGRKKGFAIPTVVVMMAIILAFSILLVSIVAGATLSTKYETAKLEKQISINKLRQDFVADGQIDETYDFDCEIVENQENANQKALVARKNGINQIYFLFIYDFSQSKVLANQTENFAITIKNVGGQDYYYLADVIKYKEV